jgi:hypothetical protein
MLLKESCTKYCKVSSSLKEVKIFGWGVSNLSVMTFNKMKRKTTTIVEALQSKAIFFTLLKPQNIILHHWYGAKSG